jgi:hypothetical protein
MPEAGNDSRNYTLSQIVPKSFLRAFSKPKNTPNILACLSILKNFKIFLEFFKPFEWFKRYNG